MTAVVDRCAALRRIMHGAEILPFACAHLGARLRGTCWTVGEQCDYDYVRFLNEEARELVQPDLLCSVRRWVCKLQGQVRGHGRCGVGVWVGMVVMERAKMLSQREGRVDLCDLV